MTSPTPDKNRRDTKRPSSWRDGPHGGAAENSPDDFDETHPEEQPEQHDAWRDSDEGPEASPDDYDEETSTSDEASKEDS